MNSKRIVSLLTFDSERRREEFIGYIKQYFSDTYIHHLILDLPSEDTKEVLELPSITRYREIFKSSMGIDAMIDIGEYTKRGKPALMIAVDTMHAAFKMSVLIVLDHLLSIHQLAKTKSLLTDEQLGLLSSYTQFLTECMTMSQCDVSDIPDNFRSIHTGLISLAECVRADAVRFFTKNPQYMYISLMAPYTHADTLTMIPALDRQVYDYVLSTDILFNKLNATTDSIRSLIDSMNNVVDHSTSI